MINANQPDYEEESLIIGDGGEPNINYGIKFSSSDHCYILQNKDKLLNIKYAFYYLSHNLHIMKQLYTGVGIKNITKPNIERIKIPIPSLERQQEMVEYLENNDILIKQLENEIERNKQLANECIKGMLSRIEDVEHAESAEESAEESADESENEDADA